MLGSDNEYIQQGEDFSCKLVALLNAFVYKFGVPPIKYKSREFRMLVEIGRGVAGPILSMKEIFTLLGVYKLEPPATGCDFQSWIRTKVMFYKQPVVFPLVSPLVGGHVTLIVDVRLHAHHGLLYACINDKIGHGAWQYLTWNELAKLQMFSSSEGPYALCWHNEADMRKLLKKPERIQQAVRDYYRALKITGFVLKPVKPVKQGVKKKKRSKRRG